MPGNRSALSLNSRADDVAMGENSENRNFLTLQRYLSTTLEHNGTYAVMDFSNPNKTVYVELKTRRIRHDQYPTALIGKNKIDFCSDPTKSYYFVYSYVDGLYAIKYSKALFDTFETAVYKRNDRPDAPAVENIVVYIPHEHLAKIE
jgi:hypothetical protein